ncbi:MAG: tRNA (adenosine(37)-N6)-threonylcarbamoyltransferase complex ATPase subunit type 1 TsaE [Acidimicrobiia bacterium]
MSALVAVTRTAEETLALAMRVGALLRGGDVLALSGDLGAGKTVFAKGVGRALGVSEPVVSPTFTVVREYEGTIRFVHVDVYRLDRIQELHDVGWDDLLDGESVALVEWGERVGALLPIDRLDVRLEVGDDDERRVVEFVASGSSWVARADALAAALGDDRCDDREEA